jgi:DNA-binding winged helix-turn-helix (wHTH) protein
MAAKTVYEFDGFLLDPERQSLMKGGEPLQLSPKAFELLLFLVEKSGQTLSKDQIFARVWGSTLVGDNNFHVTLHSVRRKIGDSARRPKYILRSASGYRFAANVKQIYSHTVENRATAAALSASPVKDDDYNCESPVSIANRFNLDYLFGRWSLHALTSVAVYSLLYTVALFLEIAYEYNRFNQTAWRLAGPVFLWMLISSLLSLWLGRRLTLHGSAAGIAVSGLSFVAAATILGGFLFLFLPPVPITASTLQSHTAQAAYMKDTIHFLVLALAFLIIPFHFIAAAEREMRTGDVRNIAALLAGDKRGVAPRAALYPQVRGLLLLLVAFAAIALGLTSRLLDHLKPGRYANLFMQLAYLRLLLYFGLGIECVLWYSQALEKLKRVCLGGNAVSISPRF